jgi:hypothetical protein
MREEKDMRAITFALTLACMAAGTACQQANATSSNAKNTATIRTTTTTTANPNARSLQLERSVYDMSHRANMYHLLNKR